jgi:hypothetical protein
MKRLWVIALVIGLAIFVLAGCGGPSAQEAISGTNTANEVRPSIFDDGQNTAYLSVDETARNSGVAEIMRLKAEWQRLFPDKVIIAISVISGDDGSTYGHTVVAGLLIHYEYVRQ